MFVSLQVSKFYMFGQVDILPQIFPFPTRFILGGLFRYKSGVLPLRNPKPVQTEEGQKCCVSGGTRENFPIKHRNVDYDVTALMF